MVSKKSRSEVRVKKHERMRNRFAGTAERPRLAVFRSNNHMYAQIIDDSVGNTLVAASTVEKAVKAELEPVSYTHLDVYKRQKPWRQKGTGHARQGSTRAPQWTGGGIVFAPTPRDYTITLNKKEKRAALKSALTSRVQENKFIVVDELKLDRCV